MFTLGRKIDVFYLTNRIIILLAIVVAIIGWLITGEVLLGMYIGGGSFFTWALARELDPKHEFSAFLCVAFSLLNLYYFKSFQLLEIFWIILLMRTVSGITGKAVTFFDIFSVLGMTVYLSISMKNAVYLIPFIIAMVFVKKLNEDGRMPLVASGIAAAAFTVEVIFFKYLSVNLNVFTRKFNILVFALIILSFFSWHLISKEKVKDDLGKIVQRSKVLLSQIVFSVAVLIIYISGEISINNLIIYLSAIAGVFIYWIGYKLFQGSRTHQ